MKLKDSFVIAFVSGAMSGGVLSYSSLWILLITMQMLLLWLLSKTSSKAEAMALLALYALGYVLAANYWLGLAIYHPPVNGLLAACLLSGGILLLHACSYMFVGLALVFVTGRRCIPSTLTWGFVLAGVWTITEIARSTGIWAMPWGLMGYAHLDNPVLKGLYPMVGAHGVAGIAWLLAALLLEGLAALRPQPGREKSRLKRGSVSLITMIAAGLTPLIDWTHVSGAPLTVRLVHTDLPGQEKYTNDAQELSLRQLQAVATQGGADLSVFPELYVVQNAGEITQAFRRTVVDAARNGQGALIFGAPTEIWSSSDVSARYNTLVQTTFGGSTNLYAKELLLPFSEYLPQSPVLSWAYPYLYNYPQADLTPGDGSETPFEVNGVKLGASICSELAYAGKASRQARGAGLLVNASSDSWVPSSAYLAQAHLIARVRAAEAQKPMVRANNVGYSAFIDERGEVLSATRGDGTTGLMAMLPRSGNTPYVAIASRIPGW